MADLIVIGAGTPGVDGIYTLTGDTFEGLPVYTNGTYFIRSFTGNIRVTSTASGYGGATIFYTNSAEMPSFVGSYSLVVNGLAPGPTVTEAVSEPTFGLPAETVALITSRFGTVANFLRLRNQGQI